MVHRRRTGHAIWLHRASYGLGVFFLMFAPAVTSAQAPEAVRRAEEFAGAMEAALRSPTAVEQFAALYGDDVGPELIERHGASVRDYLTAAPEDAEALLLAVRLDRLRDGLAWQEGLVDMFADSATPESMTPSIDGYLTIIDEILARDPASAPAHHWKARLLVEGPLLELGGVGSWIPWAIRSGESTDWDAADALAHARRAVELDPANALYRGFLAVELALDGQVAAGAEVMRQGGDPSDPLRLLIEDFDSLGVPPEAEWSWPLQGFLLRVALMGAADSEDLRFIDNAEVRYGAWTVPMSVEQFEAHFQARWPRMRFFASSDWEGAYAAALVMTPSGWTPVADSAAFEGESLDDADVLSFLVLPPEVAAAFSEGMMGGKPVPNGDPDQRLAVLFMNHRRGPGGAGGDTTQPPAIEHRPPAESTEPDQRSDFDAGVEDSEATATPIAVAKGPLEGPLYPVPGDGRLGLIDSLGTVVVEPRFSRIGDAKVGGRGPNGRGEIWLLLASPRLPAIAVESGRTGLLSADGTFRFVAGLILEGQRPGTGLWKLERAGRVGFVDSTGTIVIPIAYEAAVAIPDGHVFVRTDGHWGVVDRAGRPVVEPSWTAWRGPGTPWSEIRVGGSAGVADPFGRVIVPPQYEEVRLPDTDDMPLFGVRQDGRWGVLDSMGVLLIPPRFDHLGLPLREGGPALPYRVALPRRDGAPLVGVREAGQALYVRLDGSVAIRLTCPGGKPCACEGEGFRWGLAVAVCDRRVGVIDTTGRWVIDPEPAPRRIDIVDDSTVTIAQGIGASWVVPPEQVTRTVSGRMLDAGPPRGFGALTNPSEGLRSVVKGNGRVGVADLAGNLVIPAEFEFVGWFNQGLAPATAKSKWGMIDRSGVWVVRPEWDAPLMPGGPLTLAQRQRDDCTIEVAYFDRAGKAVYTGVISNVTYPLSPKSECARRLMRADQPSGPR